MLTYPQKCEEKMTDYRLKAINPDKNIYRWYEIKQSHNLFGTWSLIISSGRLGTKGRTRVLPFETEEEMNIILQKILKKRLTAEHRIGCNYALVNEDRIS
jgi:predicted DNA-binding WGR domain protein